MTEQPLQESKSECERVMEHWFCPGCGEVDGPRAGMRCHGPGNTGGCASVRNNVVEISHDAAMRLQGRTRNV